MSTESAVSVVVASEAFDLRSGCSNGFGVLDKSRGSAGKSGRGIMHKRLKKRFGLGLVSSHYAYSR